MNSSEFGQITKIECRKRNIRCKLYLFFYNSNYTLAIFSTNSNQSIGSSDFVDVAEILLRKKRKQTHRTCCKCNYITHTKSRIRSCYAPLIHAVSFSRFYLRSLCEDRRTNCCMRTHKLNVAYAFILCIVGIILCECALDIWGSRRREIPLAERSMPHISLLLPLLLLLLFVREILSLKYFFPIVRCTHSRIQYTCGVDAQCVHAVVICRTGAAYLCVRCWCTQLIEIFNSFSFLFHLLCNTHFILVWPKKNDWCPIFE